MAMIKLAWAGGYSTHIILGSAIERERARESVCERICTAKTLRVWLSHWESLLTVRSRIWSVGFGHAPAYSSFEIG